MEDIEEGVCDDHHHAVPQSIPCNVDGPVPPVGTGTIIVVVVAVAPAAGCRGNPNPPPASGSCKLRIIRI